ncbi:hypothetical protein K437DRAFT_278511 [Tilletiaria anomala UBC 951]|uniref:Uncharacterized protein n=1 Tax=Tilletiaria anomala (strain ATCC 24038 / CBS 436.72 / UBC 951) TaxID=1037660 RepID=A0A066W1Y7_TILAU|nr:uncharacterized protein K437DRAFT_278511 [Tilletiaria anomala UBC 951]KDN45094.1 hypothetical protein K437DRAFT_278511 [Tilletiaria anomala UBC 951]
MGPLRSHHSSQGLFSPSDSSSPFSSRLLDRYAVPAIPRWEDLRSGAASSLSNRSANPPSFQRSYYPTSADNSAAPEISLTEQSLDHFYRQSIEAEAIRRQQQMVYELERARMRERALRSEHSQMEDVRTDSTSAPAGRASSPSRSLRKSPQHKVYIINCKHCDLFLTDRGMKAVLLLKPHITLYSTDAMPTNCSPIYAPRTFLGGFASLEPPVERTCDCLTQSLGCHGCGATVGYNIVAPCARCTSNVAKHQRGSNGHRTVLHCSEIRVRERLYVPGEPGVRAAPIPQELWPLLEMENALSSGVAAAPAGMNRSSSSSSDSTVGDPAEGTSIKKYTPLPSTDLLSEQRRLLCAGKEALRAQLQARGNQGRIIMRAEPVYWSDLVAGGERAEPFDADVLLAMPVAGR